MFVVFELVFELAAIVVAGAAVVVTAGMTAGMTGIGAKVLVSGQGQKQPVRIGDTKVVVAKLDGSIDGIGFVKSDDIPAKLMERLSRRRRCARSASGLSPPPSRMYPGVAVVAAAVVAAVCVVVAVDDTGQAQGHSPVALTFIMLMYDVCGIVNTCAVEVVVGGNVAGGGVQGGGA